MEKFFTISLNNLHKNIRKLRLEIKINWEKQTNKQTTTATTKTKASKKNKNKNKKKQNKKQKTVATEKVIPSQPQPIFPKDLSQVVYLFLSQKSVY